MASAVATSELAISGSDTVSNGEVTKYSCKNQKFKVCKTQVIWGHQDPDSANLSLELNPGKIRLKLYEYNI